MRKKQPKISQKLIQIFLILLFPLMILGTLIFHFSVSELERNIADVTQKSVDSLCRDLEQEINASGGMSNFRAEVLSIASSSARIVVQPGVFNKDIPNMVMFARKVDPLTATMAEVMVEDRRAKDSRMLILAPKGNIDADYENGEILFLLKNGRSYTEKDHTMSVMGFDEYAVRFSIDTLFQGVQMGQVKPKEYSWERLYDYENQKALAKTNPRMARKIEVERHKRFVFPLACIVLCVFVIPIATSFQGLKQQTGVLMALILFLIYYSFLMLGISFGESGDLSPSIGLWVPNAMFLLLGLYGMRLADQERMPRITEYWNSRRWRKKKGAKA